MVITSFQIKDKFKKANFFPKTFLIANISIKVVLKIFFFIFNNANIFFANKKLI